MSPFGAIDLSTGVVLLVSLLATYTDLRYKKIFNWMTFPALLIGLLHGGVTGGWHGFAAAFSGVAVALLCFFWIFLLGFMSAGDVKLLMAYGAWLGVRGVLEVAVLSVLIGAVWAAVILIRHGRILRTFGKLYRFTLSLAVKELELEFPKIDRTLQMPFGVALAVAAVWTVWTHPARPWVREFFKGIIDS
jgi:prepilin peptidase CpaA